MKIFTKIDNFTNSNKKLNEEYELGESDEELSKKLKNKSSKELLEEILNHLNQEIKNIDLNRNKATRDYYETSYEEISAKLETLKEIKDYIKNIHEKIQ